MQLMVNNKKLKILITILVIVSFLCLGQNITLQYHYMRNMPKTPHPELNRIHPLDVHGTVVYLTKEEKSKLEWLHYTMVISIMIVLVIFAILANKKKITP
jgi:hypothetical protein